MIAGAVNHAHRQALWAPATGRFLLPLLAAAGLVCALLRGLGRPVPGAVLLGLALLLFLVINAGVFWMASGVFARPLLRGPSHRPLVALTFDDGPDPASTPAVLAVLAEHGAQATFFAIGDRAARHPEVLAEAAARGHQVENHSFAHAYTTPLWPVARLRRDLSQAQAAITQATGRAPRWFRPPVGILSPRVAAAARREGLRLCGYSGKARDGLAGTTVDAALRRLERALRPGAILVLHDAAERGGRDPIAPEVLRRLLPLLAGRGLRPVTLDALLSDGPAE